MSSQLRLASRTGVEFLARLVYRGDAYGVDRRQVNQGYRTLVEFTIPRGIGDHFVAVCPADELGELETGWAPGGVETLELGQRGIERLHSWLEDPSSIEDSEVLLVGDDEELEKVAVALQRLRLEPHREVDGLQALVRMRRLPPLLAVVGEQVGRLDAAELVRRIAGATEEHGVPVIALGGDEAAVRAAGAALHLPKPLDYRALVDGAAGLLEFV